VLQHKNQLFASFAGVQIKHNFHLFTDVMHIKSQNLISIHTARYLHAICQQMFLFLFASYVTQEPATFMQK